MKKKMIYKRITVCLVAAFIVLWVMPLTAAAWDYTLMDGTIGLPIAKPYEHVQTISILKADESGRDTFNNATDLFINSEGNLFVADTGNNRVVKLAQDGELLGVFYGPPESPLSGPQGVWADDFGNMFIADTGNRRIVHLDFEGNLVEEYGRPEGIYEPNYIYDPTKVAVTASGYIYALKGTKILKIDAHNVFQGELGQAKVGFHLIDFLRRIFYTESQLIQIGRRVPVECTNFFLDESDMVWASTKDVKFGELKRLNAVGESIYYSYGVKTWMQNIQEQLFGKFLNPGKLFGERFGYQGGDTWLYYPDFRDIAVDGNQIVTALCNSENRIYQYDPEGNIICSFGSDWQRPDIRGGQFQGPSSIAVDNQGRIYVLDRILNNIQIFSPTEFISTVHRALGEYYNGEYEASLASWERVLQITGSYPLAHQGVAMALHKQELYQEAMESFRRAGDYAGYTRAFSRYRHEIFRANFLLIALGVIAIAFLVIFLVSKMKKSAEKSIAMLYEGSEQSLGPVNMLRGSFAALFKPGELFELIKRHRTRLIYWPSILLLVLMAAVRVYQIYGTHYALRMIDPRTANLFSEIGQLLVPVVSFVIMQFAITSVVGGEAKLGEIFVATAYSTVPYTLITFVLVLFSPLMGQEEQGLMWVSIYIAAGWMYLLFLRNLSQLNDYSAGKTIIVAVLVVAGIILAWITILLGISLTNQLYDFFAGIIREIRFSLWR